MSTNFTRPSLIFDRTLTNPTNGATYGLCQAKHDFLVLEMIVVVKTAGVVADGTARLRNYTTPATPVTILDVVVGTSVVDTTLSGTVDEDNRLISKDEQLYLTWANTEGTGVFDVQVWGTDPWC